MVGLVIIAYHLLLVWQTRERLSRLPRRFALPSAAGSYLLIASWFFDYPVSSRVNSLAYVFLVVGILILRRVLRGDWKTLEVEGHIQTLRLS